MGVLGPEAFTRTIRRLDSEAFVSFVAGLYEAHTTVSSVEGSTIVLADGRHVECVHWRPVHTWFGRAPTIPDEADVVVSSRSSARLRRRVHTRGARYVDPERLHSFLLYGVDRDDADALCRRHLNRPLAAATEPGLRLSQIVAVGVVVLLVVAAAAAVVTGPAAVVLSVNDRVQSGGVGSGTAGLAAPSDAVVVDQQTASATPYPPGVGQASIHDVGALASAHRAVARNRSYQLLVRGEGNIRSVRPWPSDTYHYAGMPQWQSVRQRISVERPMVYRSRLTGRLAAGSGGDLIVADDYADGTTIYRRYGGNSSPKYIRVTHRSDLVAAAASEYVLMYLATAETRVERYGDGRFRLVATGESRSVPGRIRNYSAVAIVSASGFVSRLTVSYDRAVPQGDPENRWGVRSITGPTIRETSFEFRYSDVDRTTVPRPEWYDTAQRSIGVTGAPAGLSPGHVDSKNTNRTGTVDPVALAETHGAAVQGESYEWRVCHEGSRSVGVVDGRWVVSRQSATVDGPTRYTFSVSGVRDGGAGQSPVDFEIYADGTYHYRRTGSSSNGTSYERTSLPMEPRHIFADLAEQYVRRYLATSEVTVSVVDARTHHYRVVATGQPRQIDEHVSDYRAVANVTETGLVRSLDVRYVRHQPTATRLVTVDYAYDRIGNATVEPPGWSDEAHNATD